MKLLAFLLLSTLPAVVQAQFTFTTNNSAITITGYTGSGGAVTIPSTINGLLVTSIGNGAFWDRTGLTSITMGNGVTSIGSNAFALCSSLTNITIPNGLTSIGDSAFYQCTGLTNVTIPNSVMSIGQRAFGVCYTLTNVMIGSGVISIGSNAFGGCWRLSAITVDALNSVYSSLDGVLFNKSQTTLIACPGREGGSYTIPISVTNIWHYAFSDCDLTSLTIPNSVATIGNGAFEHCRGLSSVTIPGSVTSIGNLAFYLCYGLTNVTIGIGVTSLGYEAFDASPNLTAITMDTNNPAFSSLDGVLFNKRQTTLIQYPAGKAGTSYVLPNTVTSIGGFAFLGSSLASVTIPSNVTSVGMGAFYNCTGLTSITIPNSVIDIGEEAFYYCTSLSSVTIPGSVTSIGDVAFEDCTSLTKVYFGGNAPSLGGSYVFNGDKNVTIYYLPGTTGWGPKFAGMPTVLWNPQVQTGDASFGVRTNQFGFTITGTSNLVIVVEACTNLANHAWSPVGTNTLTNGSSYFSDPRWTNYPARFYRLRSP